MSTDRIADAAAAIADAYRDNPREAMRVVAHAGVEIAQASLVAWTRALVGLGGSPPTSRVTARTVAAASESPPQPGGKPQRRAHGNGAAKPYTITWNGETKTPRQWARDSRAGAGLEANSIKHRVVVGWDVEKAITTPLGRHGGSKPRRAGKKAKRRTRVKRAATEPKPEPANGATKPSKPKGAALIEHQGEKLTAREWAARIALPGVTGHVIRSRLRIGWPIDQALSEPLVDPKSDAALIVPPEPLRPYVNPPSALEPSTLIEHDGKRRSIADWANARGDATPFPLIAQLRAGMPMSEAMATRA